MQAQEATNSTQTIIFPRQASDDDQQTHKMYVHSRSFEPGAYRTALPQALPPACVLEASAQQLASGSCTSKATSRCSRPNRHMTAGKQATRQYDWSTAKIDPTSHKFGRVDCKGQQSSVKQVSNLTADAQRASAVTKQRSLEKPTLGALASASHGLTDLQHHSPPNLCVLRRCCRSCSQIWMRACASSRWCHRYTTATRPLWVTRWGEQRCLRAVVCADHARTAKQQSTH